MHPILKLSIVFSLFLLGSMQNSKAQMFRQVENSVVSSSVAQSQGCSWGDFNNDGFPDLFISNADQTNQLFQNKGDGTFQEIKKGAFIEEGFVSYSSLWADYNGDGYLDLYVNTNPSNKVAPQANLLYKNSGAPHFSFTKITNIGPTVDSNYTWSSSWVDYDNDGDLDLLVPDNRHLRTDFFYENKGNGILESIQTEFISNAVESTGVASWVDYDQDGDQDLFLIKSGRSHPNKKEQNQLFHNLLMETNKAQFTQIDKSSLTNHFDRDFQASWGDYDNDGDLDVFLGNFDAPNYLFRNDNHLQFTQMQSVAIVQDTTRTLGSSWGDYDNDGDLDLFVNNVGQANRYYQNNGEGQFTSLSEEEVGAPLTNISFVQSVANADINNDGYLDLVIANGSVISKPAQNHLYLNNGGQNHFLLLQCQGKVSNRSAIGTSIHLRANIRGREIWQMRTISGSPTGDRAQNSLRVHFGLGDAEIIEELSIRWPSGQIDTFENVVVDQFYSLVEGETLIANNE